MAQVGEVNIIFYWRRIRVKRIRKNTAGRKSGRAPKEKLRFPTG